MPSWDLVERLMRQVKVPVVVEGHITSPGEARKALELGAWAVVVGSVASVEATKSPLFDRYCRHLRHRNWGLIPPVQ